MKLPKLSEDYNTKILLISYLSLGVLFLLRIYGYFGDEFYLTNNDRWYYTAVAQSLLEYGTFQNIIYETPEALLSSQVGIILIYAFILLFIDQPETLYFISSILAALLWLSSCFPLYTLALKYQVSRFSLVIILAGVILLQEYLWYIFHGMTEGYFYPLVIWFFYFFDKVYYNRNRAIDLITLLLLAFLLILLRLQGFLIILAIPLLLFIKCEWNQLFRISGYLSLPILAFILFNVLFIKTIDDGAGQHLLSAIFSYSTEDFLSLLPILSGFLFNYNAEGFLNPYMFWGFTIPSWFLLGWLLYRNRKLLLQNNLLLFSILIITLSMAAFFASGWPRINLRYIYYCLPFYFIVVTWLASIEPHKYHRIAILAFIGIILLFNIRIFLAYNITQSYEGYEFRKEQVETFNYLDQLNANYQPEHIYMESQVRSNYRLLYITSGIPITTEFGSDFERNTFILVGKDESHSFPNDQFEKIGSFRYAGEYDIYYHH